MFHTYIIYNAKSYKVMTDGGKCVNIITKSVVKNGFES